LSVAAIAAAGLVGAGAGHFLWQPDADPGTVPGVVGSGSLPGPPFGQPGESNQADSGIVDVTTQLDNQSGGAAGTGMVLTPSGEVLTNNHVIENASSISVTDVGSHRSYPAVVVGYDRTDDVAVLQIQGTSRLPTVSIGNSRAVTPGERVVAIGNAGGVGGTPSHSAGQVSALNQSITAADETGANSQQLDGLMQVTASLQPGDSGGPLVDDNGKVIGMDTAGAEPQHESSGAGFAIPIDNAIVISRQIEAGRASPTVHIGATGFLGVQVATSALTPDSSGSTGAAVVGVQPGSPAELAGLAPGDVIVSVDGMPITSPAELQRVLSARHPGDQVTLGWLVQQTGRQGSGTARLESGPPD
jgi:S1-C subfamily serine protease